MCLSYYLSYYSAVSFTIGSYRLAAIFTIGTKLGQKPFENLIRVYIVFLFFVFVFVFVDIESVEFEFESKTVFESALIVFSCL